MWTCARSDLRRRWLSWVVLGLLAGVTVGLACAGFAGARRIVPCMSSYSRRADIPDAAVLAEQPDYDADVRAEVARLPEVEATTPFMVPFLPRGDVARRHGACAPAGPQRRPLVGEPIVEGRLPDPDRADEIVINEVLSEQFDLASATPSPSSNRPSTTEPICRTPCRTGASRTAGGDGCGWSGSPTPSDGETDSLPSPGFYERYEAQLVGPDQRVRVPA